MEQRERITTLSNQICTGLTSDYDKVKAIYTWVTKNVTYDFDYYYGRKKTTVRLPEDVLDSRLTVCEGYARLTQALIQAQNIPALRIVGAADGLSGWPQDGTTNHVWNLAYADGRWFYLDTTWGSPSGGDSGTTNYNWFDPTELSFSFNHRAVSSHIDPNGYSGDMTPEISDTTANQFTDVAADAWYAAPVDWAVKQGVTNGTSDTTFSPEKTCSRAEIITFLWRAVGSPEPKGASAFSDVEAGTWYIKATTWAAENGMASGTSFEPDEPCTRLMAVEFMWKLAGSPSAAQANFTDVSSPAVNWAVEKGVTNGTGGTSFSPDVTCTRAQIVTLLYRGFAE